MATTVVYLPPPGAWPLHSSLQKSMRLIRSIIGLASFTVVLPLAAEGQSGKAPAKSGATIHLSDSIELKPSAELQKSLDELAAAVQALALRIANDPQLRAAAIQVATGFVTTAQQVVAEKSVVIQEALKTAAERIATAETERKREPAKRP